MPAPRATYRVQLHAGFTFDDAAAIVDYLADLGVSHLYCSPFLAAAPGSTHGYDVVDHHRLNDELGGEEAYERLCRALAARDMTQVVDIVPNHMAISGRENAWWWDVLENGPSSRYASYFDIDWDPPEERMRLRVLMPILGDHVGRALDRGEIRVEREGGSFVLRYFDHAVPVSPSSVDGLLMEAAEQVNSDHLASIATALGRLPPSKATDRDSVQERHRDKEVLRENLAELLDGQPDLAATVDRAVADLNADPDGLDRLLERQNYRLAYWRVAGQELDYRRFFDITTLIGLRSENLFVFADTHEKMIELVRAGKVAGLRVDHVDGLRQPAEYVRLLRQAAGPETYLVVEKILEAEETLPDEWAVEGTTGYDFTARVNGLFVDPAGEAPLTELYGSFTGAPVDYRELVHENKHIVMRDVLAADLNRLTNVLVGICDRHRRYRDYTRPELHVAIQEILANLDVYRTYVRPGGVKPSAQDVARVEAAVARATEHCSAVDPDLFAFVGDLLLLRAGDPGSPLLGPLGPRTPLAGPLGPLEDDFALRFQQLSGAVMAKGVEDTTFYQFNRLVSLNEVGGDPGRFGTTVEEFHAANARAADHWPTAMLATSTHDTKRSEDVRARISLLSEVPDEWRAAVTRWAAMNEGHKRDGLPERNAEYLLYQALVGAHPLGADRAKAFMEKASREAKQHTSWIKPEPVYDEAMAAFVEAVVGDAAFQTDLAAFVATLVPAGRVTSLAQMLLKLTSPGVPDIYQGTEVWDLSLVDPDNRRPVDYDLRRRLLDTASAASAADVMGRADEGAPKLWLTLRALDVRRRCPAAFSPGAAYQPIPGTGERAGHVVAFVRGGDVPGAVAVVVPRLTMGLRSGWGNTTVTLPAGSWTDALGGSTVDGGGAVLLAGLLSDFPVSLLVKG
ncbi:MAG: malto-oligosyltrehalose synthase [Actinomycetota bacterium]|nr:malto-oligosyltrehalose synthase [Actinomycetota bacterium]